MEENANEIWKFQYFKVIYEYHLCAKYRILPLPSPLSLIDLVIVGIVGLVGCPVGCLLCCVCWNTNREEVDLAEESLPLQVLSGGTVASYFYFVM